MTYLAAALMAYHAAAMYDVIISPGRALPPLQCSQGCALWSNLAGDGNTRDQSAVNAKFRYGSAPSVRACALPAYDAGPDAGPGWCYCRNSHNSDWGYCLDPSAADSVPEQINLQYVNESTISIAFVTVDGQRPATPWAIFATQPTLTDGINVTGVTNYWVQDAADPRGYSFHFIQITGLSPATTYFYTVNSGVSSPPGNSSAVYSFTTRDLSAPLIIAAFGDMGVYAHNNMELLQNESGLAFISHYGDHAYQMSSDGGIRGDDYMVSWEGGSSPNGQVPGLLTRVPWVPVMGNHEYYNDALFMRYLNQTAGAAAVDGPRRDSSVHADGSYNGRWYSLSVGLLHYIVLDINPYYALEGDEVRTAQLSWLAADLKAVNRTTTPWIIAVGHMPMQCSSITYDGEFVDEGLRARVEAGEDAADVAASAPYAGCTGSGVAAVEATRADLEPLFLSYGVDLYLCGHEHNYESMWPSKGGIPVASSFLNPPAPVYVVEGAGGAPTLDLFGGPGPFTRLQDSSWGYGRITIWNATTLSYERIVNDLCKESCQSANCPVCPHPAGTVVDSWTIVQMSHGPFN